MKYKTLAELVSAYSSGELSPENSKMYLDANDATVTHHSPDDPDWLKAVDVFSMRPHDLLGQCLDLLGIPYEWS